MKWPLEKRFNFLIAPVLIALGAGCVLFYAHANWSGASTAFAQASSELRRLERLTPYPNEKNVQQMRMNAMEYETGASNLKKTLRKFVSPRLHLAPSEFQSELRVAVAGVTEEARAKQVALPPRFQLGFDAFASALPTESEAPLLQQELTQIKWILSLLMDSGVDSVVSFKRSNSGQSNPGRREDVEVTFLSSEEVARNVLNQIAGEGRYFLVVRSLRIRNEQDKGPVREVTAGSAAKSTAHASLAPDGPGKAKGADAESLRFIVGEERIEITATIELGSLLL